jgi:hypothetical protein
MSKSFNKLTKRQKSIRADDYLQSQPSTSGHHNVPYRGKIIKSHVFLPNTINFCHADLHIDNTTPAVANSIPSQHDNSPEHDSPEHDSPERDSPEQYEEELFSNLETFEDLDALLALFDQQTDPLIKLGAWAVAHKLTEACIEQLLELLVPISKIKLPKSSKTLKHTPKQKANVQKMGNGSFVYLGIKSWLSRIFKKENLEKISDSLELSINMDGFKIYDSSTAESWPIQAKLNSSNFKFKPFVVAVYYGSKKPPLEEYLKEFVEEILELSTTGYVFENKRYTIKIKMLILDAPAKSYILHIVGHAGYCSCNKCCQIGEWDGNVYFPFDESAMERRTNESFRLKTQIRHHHGQSPLELLDINMVDDIPNDYMHSVCIGVMKWLIQFWIQMHKQNKNQDLIQEINDHLKTIKSETPVEFTRKPNSISDVAHWKALEFRSFILYYGPFVMKNRLPENIYQHFLYFAVAIRILATKDSGVADLDYANDLLYGFVSEFKSHYPENKIATNIHSLLHLADDVKRFGPLDDFSAFDFENNMQDIRSMISRYNNPLPQIVKRKAEREFFFEELIRTKVNLEVKLGKSQKRRHNTLSIDDPYESVSRVRILSSSNSNNQENICSSS